jgi:cytosine/creatinine deaminase
LQKKYKKNVDVHIDQNNDPDEKDTELLANKVIEHGLEGMVNAVHACSLSAQEDDYMNEVIKLIKKAKMSVIVCPRAMLDNKQPRNKKSPTHNSLAPVKELVEGGVNVALGVDNIHDYFCPFIDGDIFTELICLIETTRLYDIDSLVDIATTNGYKILNQV